eukprot:CAMPEP_0181186416 /NCGR_PEP_ID=MMETSP1096-20121128/10021_1 /TAXON_ID=156174 ORGANISM="Chrysochromulina ericina, Strain CCMP281" /NCGR_SAMPLE_ID=MMETSP1096 /ASSEMBLY_ACC=CAM_ASM_000453 /LENGTH=63 /DNA_ID=CAMNT_0023275309 /DNA_START=200 /DNA_END=391 /DNA_ORIENTATION=-
MAAQGQGSDWHELSSAQLEANLHMTSSNHKAVRLVPSRTNSRAVKRRSGLPARGLLYEHGKQL